MKNIKISHLVSAASICLLFFSCEKDDSPSPIPTTPNSFFPANGEVISEIPLNLKASGSNVDNKNDIYYHYYLGEDTANMEKSDDYIGYFEPLTPGTKYYWKAIPYTSNNGERYYGETSQIHHFYTQPESIKNIESHYADESIILTWKNPENCKNIMISVTAQGASSAAHTASLNAGEESFTIKNLQNRKIFSVTIYGEISVADTVLTTSKITVNEMPLDSTKYAHDIDFNIYNLVKIGNQVWMKENLRVSRLNDGTTMANNGSELTKYIFKPSEFLQVENKIDSIYGFHYHRYIGKSHPQIAPKGFRLPSVNDWLELFSFISGEEVNTTDSLTYYSSDERNFYGKLLKASSGWNEFEGETGNGEDAYGFSIFPSGSFSIMDQNYTEVELNSIGYSSGFFVDTNDENTYEMAFFYSKKQAVFQRIWDTSSIRCIKISE